MTQVIPHTPVPTAAASDPIATHTKDLPATPTKEARKFPVMEIFGPTLQGEGALAGVATSFVRFGGCGYRCSWCDTLYAVLPEEVKANRKMMNAYNICDALVSLGWVPTITLSGGDPCIHDLWPVIYELRRRYIIAGKPTPQICVETQGQLWQDWLSTCSIVTISPKPPSAKVDVDLKVIGEIIHRVWRRTHLKFVVRDATDFEWVMTNFVRNGEFNNIPMYMQPMTPQGFAAEQQIQGLIVGLEQLVQRVLRTPELFNRPGGFRVMPQMHRLMFPHQDRGV
jgi:7-carboxy-7-deazaguanine synthase